MGIESESKVMEFWDWIAFRQTLLTRIERTEGGQPSRDVPTNCVNRLRVENARLTLKVLDLHLDLNATLAKLEASLADKVTLEEQVFDFAKEATEKQLRIEELERQIDGLTHSDAPAAPVTAKRTRSKRKEVSNEQ